MKYKIEEMSNGDLVLFKKDSVLIIEKVTKAYYDKENNAYLLKNFKYPVLLSKEMALKALQNIGEEL